MRYLLIAATFTITASSLAAPDLEERYLAAARFESWNRDHYVRNDAIEPRWTGNGDAFWYRRETREGHDFLLVDPRTATRRKAFDHAQVAHFLGNVLKEDVSEAALPFDTFSVDGDGIAFEVGGNRYRCAGDGCRAAPRENTPDGSVRSPGGAWSVFFRGHDLWARETASGSAYPLTRGSTADSAFGISTGTDISTITRRRQGLAPKPLVVFSPCGERFAVQHVQQSQVGELSLIDQAPAGRSRRPTRYTMRYAMAGDRNKPLATLAVFELAERTRTDVDAEPMELVFSTLTHPLAVDLRWENNCDYFQYIHRYQGGKGFSIRRVHAASGSVTTLVDRPGAATTFPGPTMAMGAVFRPVGDGGVIYFSDDDGWGHLYFRAKSGEERQLTRGAWSVHDILHLDEERGEVVYLRGRAEADGNPYETVAARVSLRGGDSRVLTPESGVHQVSATDFSPSGSHFIDRVGSMKDAGETLLRNRDGTVVMSLAKTDISRLALDESTYPQVFTVTAADGETALWGHLFRPSHFDPDAHYPVIDSIYPGPQHGRLKHTLIDALYRPFGSPQALAELGFIVLTIEGRGTPGRSRAFNYPEGVNLLAKAGFLEDHVAAIRQLAASRPWLDLDRIGIYGHSGGGYASTRALLTYPDVYQVAVASAGNHEQRSYIPVWAESYLGTADPARYAAASNVALAGQLEGKLLLVIGNMDDNVHPTQSYQLAQALIDADKDFDMLVLPRANHRFEAEMPYFVKRLWGYFVEHLMGEKPPAHFSFRPDQPATAAADDQPEPAPGTSPSARPNR
ncbi:MAG: S9 family peptidase [Pseudohaliea sp.]